MCGGGGQREAKAGEEVTKIPVLLDSMLGGIYILH